MWHDETGVSAGSKSVAMKIAGNVLGGLGVMWIAYFWLAVFWYPRIRLAMPSRLNRRGFHDHDQRRTVRLGRQDRFEALVGRRRVGASHARGDLRQGALGRHAVLTHWKFGAGAHSETGSCAGVICAYVPLMGICIGL